MELTGVGGGIMLAIAAVLWLAYLLPSWLKNREYLATEKNAVRLQQTIRVLAETSEVSRTELLRQLPSGPVAVGRPVRQVFDTPDRRSVGAVHRLRRTRVATAFVLLLSVVVGLVQVGVMIAGGGVATAWLLLGASGLGVLSSFAMLGRLAEVSRARRAPVQRSARRTSLGHAAASAAPAAQDWTPVPVPKPLYLSRGTAAPTPAVDPAFELEVAAAAAERALCDVEQPPAIAPVVQPAAASSSRFASMGIVDAASAPAPDIDAALARRRAAG
jgi:hypothetical protein